MHRSPLGKWLSSHTSITAINARHNQHVITHATGNTSRNQHVITHATGYTSRNVDTAEITKPTFLVPSLCTVPAVGQTVIHSVQCRQRNESTVPVIPLTTDQSINLTARVAHGHTTCQ
jgi:DNA-binding protein